MREYLVLCSVAVILSGCGSEDSKSVDTKPEVTPAAKKITPTPQTAAAVTPAPTEQPKATPAARVEPKATEPTTVTAVSTPAVQATPEIDGTLPPVAATKSADVYDSESKTLVQFDGTSVYPIGVNVPKVEGRPGAEKPWQIGGTNLLGARVYLRRKQADTDLTPINNTDTNIEFDKIPDLEEGEYDLIIQRKDGTKVVRPMGVEIIKV